MVQLIDTAIGFVAILAVLSLIVKSLTSLIKSYIDYYSANLHSEANALIEELLGRSLEELSVTHPWISTINWKSLGEEFLQIDKVKVFVNYLDPTLDLTARTEQLKALVDLHLANLRYEFERRMKNLALASGLGLCLLCNINALTIWKTLYTDQQIRTTFATTYAQKALSLTDSGNKDSSGNQPLSHDELQEKAKNFKEQVGGFLNDVSFGVGRVWGHDDINYCYEFLGSLLTGVLISVGAPYWHDLLRTLSQLRKGGSDSDSSATVTPAPAQAP
jgi:hypothetical protein